MPLILAVQLTTRCNFDCEHCFVDHTDTDVSLDVLHEIIQFAKLHNLSSLAFTGGEPTLHPQYAQIMDLLSKHQLNLALVTNGWNFADLLPTIRPYLGNLKHISLSLESATEELHDRIRRQGSYRRVLQAISICRHKKIPFALNMTVNKRNMDQLEEMTLLATKMGAEYLAILPLMPTPRTASSGMILDPEDMQSIKEASSRLRKIFNMKIVLTAGFFDGDPLSLCPALTMRELFITAKGDASFCCHLANYRGGTGATDILGNLAHISPQEAHQRMVDEVARLMKDKIRRYAAGAFSELDYYPCWYCLKYFSKVDWMRGLEDNPWSRDLLDWGFRKNDDLSEERKTRWIER